MLLAVGTSLTGLWTLAHFSDLWNIKALWELIAGDSVLQNRRLAHAITGSSIIVLLLLLSFIARVTAGRRFVVLLFTMLLIVALTAQVWFGSLLMFDTPSGPIGSFNGSPAALSGTTTAGEPESAGTAPATAPAIPPPATKSATATTAPAK